MEKRRRLQKKKAGIEFVSFSFLALEKADKVSGGKVSETIEKVAGGKMTSTDNPRPFRSDTSAAGQTFSGGDGKKYRVIFDKTLRDGRIENSTRKILVK